MGSRRPSSCFFFISCPCFCFIVLSAVVTCACGCARFYPLPPMVVRVGKFNYLCQKMLAKKCKKPTLFR